MKPMDIKETEGDNILPYCRANNPDFLYLAQHSTLPMVEYATYFANEYLEWNVQGSIRWHSNGYKNAGETKIKESLCIRNWLNDRALELFEMFNSRGGVHFRQSPAQRVVLFHQTRP